MKTRLFAVAAVTGLALASSALAATDIGGSINLVGSSANYFNPGNGFVPPGFGNSDGPLVTIGSWVEFGYARAESMGQADFSSSTLHLSLTRITLSPGAHVTFKASTPAFFDDLKLVQTTLRGMSFKVDDNTLILDWEAGSVDLVSTADFTFKGDGLGGPPGGPDDGPPTGGPPDGGPPKVDPPGGGAPGSAGPGPVPEPSTWAMMVLGFGGLGAALRRRRAKGSSLSDA